MLRRIDRPAHRTDIAGDARRGLVVNDQTALYSCRCPARRAWICCGGAPSPHSTSIASHSSPIRLHMSIQRWLNWPYRKASTLSPGERVLASADSQPPVPVAGKTMTWPCSVLKTFFRSRSSGPARSGKLEERWSSIARASRGGSDRVCSWDRGRTENCGLAWVYPLRWRQHGAGALGSRANACGRLYVHTRRPHLRLPERIMTTHPPPADARALLTDLYWAAVTAAAPGPALAAALARHPRTRQAPYISSPSARRRKPWPQPPCPALAAPGAGARRWPARRPRDGVRPAPGAPRRSG